MGARAFRLLFTVGLALPGVYGTALACQNASQCNDGNVCTADTCNASGSCVNTPVADSSGIPCTNGTGFCARSGTCIGGHCNAPIVTCSDGDPCTSDFCTLSGGCVHYNATNPQPVGGLEFSPDRVHVHWQEPTGACKPRGYQAASGGLTVLPVGSHSELERCISAPTTQLSDAAIPESGEALWYDVRAYYLNQLTGSSDYGPYGHQLVDGVDSARQTTVCP